MRRVGVALTRANRGGQHPRKPALRYQPSRAKAERVALSAADLDLDAIDALVAHESEGLKLLSSK